MSKRHLWVSTYDIYLSGSEVPNSIWCFLDPSICPQISKCHFFFSCVAIHCVKVPHFPYSFFSRGAFRLFTDSGYDKQCCYVHSWPHVLGHISKSGIAGSWGRLFLNFLRNRHTNIQRSCTSLHSHQQCRSVPFTHNLSSTNCHQYFWSWSFLQV